MNYLQRGILSITRRKTKSLILLLIIFILGDVMAGAISVEQAIKKAEENVLNKTGAIATIELDYDKTANFTEEDYRNKVKSITPAKINEIGESEYLKYYDYTSTTSLQSDVFKRYVNDDSSMGLFDSMLPYPDDMDYPEYFSINGVQNEDIVDLKLNKIKLSEGRKFSKEEVKSVKYVAMVSKKFAEKNDLRVGSKMKLKNVVAKIDDYFEDNAKIGSQPSVLATQEIEFEIVGIFTVVRPAKADPNNDYIYDELENRIYSSNKVVESINNFTINEYKKTNPEYAEQLATYSYLTPIFVLKNPTQLEQFKESIKKDIPEYYKITDNGSSYRKIAAPMKNMKWISSIVLSVSIGATLLILSLLITLFLRDRKHEIGIYLALGEEKKKVIGQIVAEVFIVAFVGITMSLFAGGLIASSVSKEMLNNQLIEESKDTDIDYNDSSSLDWMGYSTSVTSEDIINSYSVSINGSTTLLFYLIGLGTVLVSTILPVLYITRLKPKKILL